jgi:hypothetical protein
MSRTGRMNEFDQRMVAEAEADLQQLLSVEPSPELAARVRLRVHERTKSHAWRWGWIGLALASAAALIVAVVLRTNHSVPGEQTIEMVHRPDVPLIVPATMVRDTPPSSPQGAVKVARHYAGRFGVAQAPAPEIIVDPAMTAAIRRFAASLRNVPPDESVAETLQAEAGDPRTLPVAKPLDVPQLVLKPADQNGGN